LKKKIVINLNLLKMKKIFFLVLVLFVKITTAQTTGMVTEYDTCNHLRQYEGEWVYANGLDTIKIFLRFHRRQYVQSDRHRSITDYLVGWHMRKQGNLVIESNYQHRFIDLPFNLENFSSNYYSISLRFAERINTCGWNSRHLSGRIVDYNELKRLQAVKIELNSAKTIMTWKQQHTDNYGGPFSTAMTLPAEFNLVRQ
jgi:hypothetical protein